MLRLNKLWLETIWQDIRNAFRLWRRTPAVVFTAIQSVLLNPLPYTRPGDLVQLRSDDNAGGGSHTDWIFWNDAQELARRTRTVESAGVYRTAVFDLGGGPLATTGRLGAIARLRPDPMLALRQE